MNPLDLLILYDFTISGKILAKEVRFPQSEIFFATLAPTFRLKKVEVLAYTKLISILFNSYFNFFHDKTYLCQLFR